MCKLASTPIHPDQRFARFHIPLLYLHVLPQSTMRVLLHPPPYSLPDLVQLVRPMFLRPWQ